MAEEGFPQSPDAVVATLTELFRHQNNRAVCEVLDNAKAKIEETGYDGWNGGTYYYTLFLDLPLKTFAQIEPDVLRLEKAIAGKISSVLRNPGNRWLQTVTISPILEQPVVAVASKVAPVDVEHLWESGMFRLFLSHVAAHKAGVSKLKVHLLAFGISSFVAHEDIEPNQEWQREIDLALRSMQALIALLTPDFHQSRWTDQEVGFALGKGVPVIPVRLGTDPYGFIGKQQGLPGNLDAPEKLASAIVNALLRHRSTVVSMRESLVFALAKSVSWATSKAITSKLETLEYFTTEQLNRMDAACKENSQVRDSFGVPERIKTIIQRFEPPSQEETPF